MCTSIALLSIDSSHPYSASITCSREQLIEALYGWEESIESNAIDVHIHHLRRKLGSSVIENQRGLGWRLATRGRG